MKNEKQCISSYSKAEVAQKIYLEYLKKNPPYKESGRKPIKEVGNFVEQHKSLTQM